MINTEKSAKEAESDNERITRELYEKLDIEDFKKNKGQLPWPIDDGIVTGYFGIHQHPVLDDVNIINNGIDIDTNEKTVAKAVFDGRVVKIVAIPGGNHAVVISHNDYFTVYSNLSDVSVSTGEKISALQTLGTIHTNKQDMRTVLEFQLWFKSKKIDPLLWLQPH